VVIGSFCFIADDCHIGGAAHPLSYVSTSPVFLHGKNILRRSFLKYADSDSMDTIIDADVWIGQGAFLKEGIHIGTEPPKAHHSTIQSCP